MTWVLRILIPKPGVADTGAGLGGARFVYCSTILRGVGAI